MKYAKLTNNQVTEILVAIDGFTIEQCFHPDILKDAVPVPSQVEHGWTLIDGTWTAPQPTE